MRRDLRWPTHCSLSGCDRPALRGHHHHFIYGHLSILSCQCETLGESGTRPWQADEGPQNAQ